MPIEKLYITYRRYAGTSFPQFTGWKLETLSQEMQRALTCAEISVAPPGKHDLALCPGYEAQWRRILPRLIEPMQPSGYACFVWAVGPIEWDGLPRVLPYIVRGDRSGNRYCIPGVSSVDLIGYRTSWASFEYHDATFVQLMEDRLIDLENTRLFMMMFPEKLVKAAITSSFALIGLEWVMSNGALAFTPSSHFEGYYVIGESDLANRGLDRIRQSFSTITLGPTDAASGHET